MCVLSILVFDLVTVLFYFVYVFAMYCNYVTILLTGHINYFWGPAAAKAERQSLFIACCCSS